MDIYLYDQIMSGDAERVVTQLAGAAGPVTVRVNSPGGSVSEGLAIFNALSRHNQRIEMHIDGLAASIASLIVMAGDRIYMARSALLMIHAPWISGMDGNASELRRAADALDVNARAMISAYASKTKLSSEAVLDLMSAETWLTADEARAAGFVDEIVAPLPMAASVRFDLSAFRNPPVKEFVMTQENDPLAAERARTAAIRQVFAVFPKYRALEADCLADMSVSEAVARQRLLEEMGRGCEPLGVDLPNAGQHSIGRVQYGANEHHADFRAAARDAILTRYGVPVKDAHPAAADVMGMSIVDIARTMAEQSGRAPFIKTKARFIKAALTTSDFPALMENIAEKVAMTGFREMEVSSHRAWTRSSMLPDFKQARRVALSEAPGLEKVIEGGEYHYGSLSDAKESIQLDTYGKIVSITRQALINDDLGELTRVPEALGQAAARREADLVYGLLTSNPTMRDSKTLFHADHSNLAVSGAALSVASLGAARAAMRKQTGLAGVGYLNIVPKYLVVPVALETVAEQLMITVQPSATGDTVPAWVHQLIVITEPRLDDDSATAWYLAGNPAAHDTIEVATLDGQQPYVESEDGFDVDATKIKIRIDVGAAAIDWRALYKNAGA